MKRKKKHATLSEEGHISPQWSEKKKQSTKGAVTRRHHAGYTSDNRKRNWRSRQKKRKEPPAVRRLRKLSKREGSQTRPETVGFLEGELSYEGKPVAKSTCEHGK